MLRGAFCLALVTCATTVQAERWIPITGDEGPVFYVDADAMVWEQSVATVWVKVTFPSAGKKDVKTSVEKWMLDCENRRSKLIAMTQYGPSGGVIGSAQIPRYRQDWSTIVPKSNGEVVFNAVCGLQRPSKPVGEVS